MGMREIERRVCGLGSGRRIGGGVGGGIELARCIAAVLWTSWMELWFFFGRTEGRLVHLDIFLDPEVDAY